MINNLSYPCFLELDIVSWLNQPNGVDQLVVRDVSFEQLTELKNYLKKNGVSELVKLEYSPLNTLFISCGSLIRASASSPFCNAFAVFNQAVTDNYNYPLKNLGKVDVPLSDCHWYTPDLSCQVMGRTDSNCPNLVGEVHAKSALTMREFVDKGLDYFTYTAGILVVILVKLYDNGSMVYCEIPRDSRGNMSIVKLISFGSVALTLDDANEWMEVTGLSMTGVGHGGPDCTRENPYCQEICGSLLRQNSEGEVLYNPSIDSERLPAVVNSEVNLVFDLFDVQVHVMEK